MRLSAALLLFWLPLMAQAVSEEEVSVSYRNGLYIANLSIGVAAPPSVVFSVLTDFEHMADFMPGLISSRIIWHQANVYQIAQSGKVKFGPFSMKYDSERRIEIIDSSHIHSQSVAGSARRMHSDMHLKPSEQGTRIDYHIELEPESWIPSALGTSFMQHELAEQFSALTQEMLRRH